MIISIASGKGGTGKTLIATNLALAVERNVQLLDCDVEEPNAHIFFVLRPLDLQKVYLPLPVVNVSLCDYCGICAQKCKFNAIAVVKEKVLIFPDLCRGCGFCIFICPRRALTPGKKQIGEVRSGEWMGINLVWGRLNIGEPLGVRVIWQIKKQLKKDKTVIIDAPPGTTSGMIEAVKGSGYCILVTEPTPFGLYDLKCAVEVVKMLGIPYGVIINRSDIGDTSIENYCDTEGIEILLKLPQDEKISYLYSKGIPFVSELPQWRRKLLDIYNSSLTRM